MKRVGLIDIDSHNFPNLPLMKISAWHKAQGDSVEWYDAWNGLIEQYDKVYVSKVFSFSPDYEHPIYAKISIHPPLVGRDVPTPHGRLIDADISIHPPLAGRDGKKYQ